MKRIIGNPVHVVIDRPLGSAHPQYKDLLYEVNYGFIPGIMAPDGEEQDAYVLGPNTPLQEFDGIVTAVLVRENDIETKWVVESPESTPLTDEEILTRVHFSGKVLPHKTPALGRRSINHTCFARQKRSFVL